ncbi:1730_t:CDS:2 [Ambispora gerdemannii]|uniref:1730_t:CDS:1 n=1 Tax=Ambispora gerdemannii TaxID=144530 RepID=A0A9N9ADF0_9GLOM|nr:1730_t:CDS:2 [Ambispora gerdemannii]
MASSKKWLDDAISEGKIHQITYDQITKIENIGEGSFGKVYSAECDLFSEKIVIKKIKKCHIKEKEKDKFYAFIKELKIHSTLDHANIIRLYGISENKNSYFLVMQFANNGTLREFLKEKHDTYTLDWAKKISLAKQMADGIQYLHSRDIIHRDLQALMRQITKGLREEPLPDTPFEYMELYQYCWKLEPEDRPLIQEVCSRLDSILIDLDYSPALADITDEFDDRLDSKLLAADLEFHPDVQPVYKIIENSGDFVYGL